VCVGVLHDFVDQPENGRLQRVLQWREWTRIPAAGGDVLDQIVRANREEICLEQVDGECRRRHFHHHTQFGNGAVDLLLVQMRNRAVEQNAHVIELARRRDHRHHDPERPERRRARERA
jgi:hypothetical protein